MIITDEDNNENAFYVRMAIISLHDNIQNLRKF